MLQPQVLNSVTAVELQFNSVERLLQYGQDIPNEVQPEPEGNLPSNLPNNLHTGPTGHQPPCSA